MIWLRSKEDKRWIRLPQPFNVKMRRMREAVKSSAFMRLPHQTVPPAGSLQPPRRISRNLWITFLLQGRMLLRLFFPFFRGLVRNNRFFIYKKQLITLFTRALPMKTVKASRGSLRYFSAMSDNVFSHPRQTFLRRRFIRGM